MKEKKKKELTLFQSTLIVVFIIISLVGLTLFYFRYERLFDTRARLPLNKDQVYMITIQETEILQLGRNTPAAFYVITPIRHANLEFKAATLGWVAIGTKTEFDFTPYLNQPVYIKGKFYEGEPIRIYPKIDNENSWVVLRIDDLELVDF